MSEDTNEYVPDFRKAEEFLRPLRVSLEGFPKKRLARIQHMLCCEPGAQHEHNWDAPSSPEKLQDAIWRYHEEMHDWRGYAEVFRDQGLAKAEEYMIQRARESSGLASLHPNPEVVIRAVTRFQELDYERRKGDFCYYFSWCHGWKNPNTGPYPTPTAALEALRQMAEEQFGLSGDALRFFLSKAEIWEGDPIEEGYRLAKADAL